MCEKKQIRRFRNAGQALKNERKGLKRGIQRTPGTAVGESWGVCECMDGSEVGVAEAL